MKPETEVCNHPSATYHGIERGFSCNVCKCRLEREDVERLLVPEAEEFGPAATIDLKAIRDAIRKDLAALSQRIYVLEQRRLSTRLYRLKLRLKYRWADWRDDSGYR